MDPDNNRRGQVPADATLSNEIASANTINDYLINAKDAGRLVYCRMGEKFINDLEKRKNSNLNSVN
jgi:hypothetical protein